ncbi:hypothetical protein F383_29765 [Gossypium arboreum]|uniref:Uncharacterized protein n=1 Tax=Gossypium arboreum TaxID=29729 RepID=A0A0B0PIJ8_GOSAR|nr:hypothetical protein F383_29765 [Gossypium arboreum]
MLHTASHMGV